VQWLDPALDVVFKLLFANAKNRDILIALLTAVLRPTVRIEAVNVLKLARQQEGLTHREELLEAAALNLRMFASNRGVDNLEGELVSESRSATCPRPSAKWTFAA
jgi:PD-(D/E)XK nuclease family transposase